jgi:hypothetical protein
MDVKRFQGIFQILGVALTGIEEGIKVCHAHDHTPPQWSTPDQ